MLVFSPHFPTFLPNIERRQARAVLAPLSQKNEFRPDVDRIERFLAEDPSPKAIFLNSPHNPTGGVATEDDLKRDRGRRFAARTSRCSATSRTATWSGRAGTTRSRAAGMLDASVGGLHVQQVVQHERLAAGVRGRVAPIADAIGKMINTSLSCMPPIVQLAGTAALQARQEERDRVMQKFRDKVVLLTTGLNRIEGIHALDPTATFYVFPNVAPICNRLGITSHGLALYLLEGADDKFGVACLGGECFGEAGAGFLRFSCAEPNDRLQQALDFIPKAIARTDRLAAWLEKNPHYRLAKPYAVE